MGGDGASGEPLGELRDGAACGEGEGPGSVDGNEGFDAGPNHLREIVVGGVLGVGKETCGDRPTLGERNPLQRGGEPGEIVGAALYARVKETYDLMSQKYFTHATPTLFNAGTPRPQMSSCFLVAMKDDSIDGIYETLKECAHISKWSGGIGIHCSNIRANGTRIKGTNGVADGIVPMLRVFNNTARYVNQGGGKRKGSFAIYLEPWHADIMEFLELRLNQGVEEMRCRDLFTAMWIPDLFMEQVEKDVFIRFIHRPMSRYVNALAEHGLVIERMVEPSPPPGFLARSESYAAAAAFPRLLYFRLRKMR